MRLGEFLGEGGYGLVELGRDLRTGRLLAIKSIPVTVPRTEEGSVNSFRMHLKQEMETWGQAGNAVHAWASGAPHDPATADTTRSGGGGGAGGSGGWQA